MMMRSRIMKISIDVHLFVRFLLINVHHFDHSQANVHHFDHLLANVHHYDHLSVNVHHFDHSSVSVHRYVQQIILANVNDEVCWTLMNKWILSSVISFFLFLSKNWYHLLTLMLSLSPILNYITHTEKKKKFILRNTSMK